MENLKLSSFVYFISKNIEKKYFTFVEAAASYYHTATDFYRANIRPYISKNYDSNSNRNFTTKG